MTPTTIHVRPGPGLVVRDPVTGTPLPPEGAAVPRTSYWLRRLRDGDATEVPAPAVPALPLAAED